jgi:hypothetical protein
MKSTVPLDVREPRDVGRHETIAQSELPAQFEALRLLDEERIGAGVDCVTIDLFAQDHSAGPRGPLDDYGCQAAPVQLERRGESRDSAAGDEHVDRFGVHGRQILVRTRSSSTSMNRRRVGDSVRAEGRRSRAAAHRERRVGRISVWSQTEPMGATGNRFAPRSRAPQSSG